MKSIILSLILLLSISSYGGMEKADKIDKLDRKTFDQVKLQAGSYVILDQFMKKKHDLKDDEDFELKFICKKVKKSRVCKVIEYQALKRQKR